MDFHFFSRDISNFDELFIFLLLGGTSSILRTFLGGTSQKILSAEQVCTSGSLILSALGCPPSSDSFVVIMVKVQPNLRCPEHRQSIVDFHSLPLKAIWTWLITSHFPCLFPSMISSSTSSMYFLPSPSSSLGEISSDLYRT